MYMAGYDDEEAFDAFAQTLTLKGVASKITCLYLIVAGEDDELCPMEYVYELLEEVKSPKVLKRYQGEKHSIRNPEARPYLIGSKTGWMGNASSLRRSTWRWGEMRCVRSGPKSRFWL